MDTIAYKSKGPRDKVYAILGISSDGKNLPFKPNYTDSVEEVFTKTTAYILTTKEWFSILLLAGRGYDSNLDNSVPSPYRENLPSWVPDFSSNNILGVRALSKAGILARDTAGQVTFVNDRRVIQVQAIQFALISHLGSAIKVRGLGSLPPNPNSAPNLPFVEKAGHLQGEYIEDHKEWYLRANEIARAAYAAVGNNSDCNNVENAATQAIWELCTSQEERGDSLGSPQTVCAPRSESARKFFDHVMPSFVEIENDAALLTSLHRDDS